MCKFHRELLNQWCAPFQSQGIYKVLYNSKRGFCKLIRTSELFYKLQVNRHHILCSCSLKQYFSNKSTPRLFCTPPGKILIIFFSPLDQDSTDNATDLRLYNRSICFDRL